MRFLREDEIERLDLEITRGVRLKASEIECVACGFFGNENEFYNSSVHNKFKNCPICVNVRFVCEENRGYIKNTRSQ